MTKGEEPEEIAHADSEGKAEKKIYEALDENTNGMISQKTEPKKYAGLAFDHYLSGGAIGFSLAMIMTVVIEWLLEKSGV